MVEAGYLVQVCVLLAAAIVCVTVVRRLGQDSALGYLIGGILIGPSGLALVVDEGSIHALAELGVVFLLFTVGLELPVNRLRLLRRQIVFLALAQIFGTAGIVALLAWHLGLDLIAALAVGAALSLSSTALVARMLASGDGLTSRFGREVVALLLIQDLMAAPFLAIVIALGDPDRVIGVSLAMVGVKMIIAIVAIFGLGRLLFGYLFSSVAAARDPEIFTALTLFVVLTAAGLTAVAGLSLAFGAFLAGMLLADTAFRHQVAADILPFRGLLLGLFFVSVGLLIDLDELAVIGDRVLVISLALLIGKAVIIVAFGVVLGLSLRDSTRLGLLLSQCGEFGFVLLGAAGVSGLLDPADLQVLLISIAVTMLATPGFGYLARYSERFLGRAQAGALAKAEAKAKAKAAPAEAEESKPAAPSEAQELVVLCGLGSVGLSIAGDLAALGRPFVAIDLDVKKVTAARKQGYTVFFGDVTRPEVLAEAGLDRATAVVVSIDNPKSAVQCVALVHYVFPELMVFARARDASHGDELSAAGANVVVPELLATARELSQHLAAKLAGQTRR
jgi:CPA2 family monovalent cation:H+ antiporter-2